MHYSPQTLRFFVNDPGANNAVKIANALVLAIRCIERLLLSDDLSPDAWWYGQDAPLTEKDRDRISEEMGLTGGARLFLTARTHGIAEFLGEVSEHLPELFHPPFSQNAADPMCLANRIRIAIGRPCQFRDWREIDKNEVVAMIVELTARWRELEATIISLRGCEDAPRRQPSTKKRAGRRSKREELEFKNIVEKCIKMTPSLALDGAALAKAIGKDRRRCDRYIRNRSKTLKHP